MDHELWHFIITRLLVIFGTQPEETMAHLQLLNLIIYINLKIFLAGSVTRTRQNYVEQPMGDFSSLWPMSKLQLTISIQSGGPMACPVLFSCHVPSLLYSNKDYNSMRQNEQWHILAHSGT